MLAPFNFGIDKVWYEGHKNIPSYRIHLRDWYQYPGPEGFELVNDAAPRSDTNGHGNNDEPDGGSSGPGPNPSEAVELQSASGDMNLAGGTSGQEEREAAE